MTVYNCFWKLIYYEIVVFYCYTFNNTFLECLGNVLETTYSVIFRDNCGILVKYCILFTILLKLLFQTTKCNEMFFIKSSSRLELVVTGLKISYQHLSKFHVLLYWQPDQDNFCYFKKLITLKEKTRLLKTTDNSYHLQN